MNEIIQLTNEICKSLARKEEMRRRIKFQIKQVTPNSNKSEYYRSGTSFVRTSKQDEIPFSQVLLQRVYPVIKKLYQSSRKIDHQRDKKLLQETKKVLYNWKQNPENNEKYLRKEFKFGIENKKFVDSRSLLGIVQHPKWIENLNIGTIMHMNPITYEEYALKREDVFQITKEQLQEKIIFQSICYFTMATEMRFTDIAESRKLDKLVNKRKKKVKSMKGSGGSSKKKLKLLVSPRSD